MTEADILTQVRALRDQGLGRRRICRELNISSPAAAQRLIDKLAIEDMQRGANLPVVIKIEPQTAAEFAERITQCWRKSVEAIFEAGRLLARAKDTLEHGEFLKMIETDLPFGPRTAQRLMAVSSDQRLTNATHVSHLPASWGTLYELTKLDDDAFAERIADGTIHPDMERRDITQTLKRQARSTREAKLGEAIAAGNLALPSKKYGVILADPEWRFEPYSRETGMDRAADNHYATSPTESIMARPVADIAADDCVIFLWATAPMLPDALRVMEAWGFEYRSHIIWPKDKLGTGYWFRSQHELVLCGARGKIPAPAMGTQWLSVQPAPAGEHSEKPDWQYELIEAYFPTLPKIELNARRAREGWDSWGAEAPGAEAP